MSAQRVVLQRDRGWKISADGCYLPAYLPATDTDLPVAGMQLSADIQCAYRYCYAKQLLPRCKNDVTALGEWCFLAAVIEVSRWKNL